MSDTATAAAAGATAVTAFGAVIGMPAGNVIFAALIGAVVSVWLQHASTAALNRQWLVRAVGSLAVALIAGVLAPVFVQAYAPKFDWLTPLLRIDGVILAALGALCAHKALALLNRWIDRKAKD
jgi:hypothetical protein